MHVKAIVAGTEGRTHPDSRRPRAVPPSCLRRTAGNQDGVRATVLQREMPTAQDTDGRMLQLFT